MTNLLLARVFTNTFHLYLWLFLFTLPLSLHLYFPTSAWCVLYCTILHCTALHCTASVLLMVNTQHTLNTGHCRYVWLLYAIIIGVFFTIIKLLNAGLHHLFDTGEVLLLLLLLLLLLPSTRC